MKVRTDPTCAHPTLQGSVYDADSLDIPPPIAAARALPAALEAEEYEDDKYHKNPKETDTGKGRLFFNGIKALWLTRQGLENDRIQLLKVTVRELITYLTFLALCCIGSLLDALYWRQTDTHLATLLQGSRLLGSPRLRMLKVNNHSCTIVSSFKREIRECFGPYGESAEDREPFGPANNSAFVLELPASGGVIPSSALIPQRLIRYVTTYDYFAFVCELLFIAFTFYYVIQAILEIVRLRLAYFANFWNCFDVVNLMVRNFTFTTSISDFR
uniref:Uncharacterized protein n=1 Tax=Parascaris equorum TaxID=6256 RepID=A0A914RQH1_PAREQ